MRGGITLSNGLMPWVRAAIRSCRGAPEDNGAPSVFEWAGGAAAFSRMTRLFYEKYVPAEPLLAPLFADMATDHPERVAAWLAETFGGPKTYTEQYGGYDWMVSQHAGKALTEAQRACWVRLMSQCADEAGLRPTQSSERPSSPTSSGARGSPWRTPAPAQPRPSTCPFLSGRGSPTRPRAPVSPLSPHDPRRLP